MVPWHLVTEESNSSCVGVRGCWPHFQVESSTTLPACSPRWAQAQLPVEQAHVLWQCSCCVTGGRHCCPLRSWASRAALCDT